MYGHHHHHHACVPFQYIRGITKYRERTAVGTPRSPRLLSACFFFAFPFFVSLFVASSFFFLFRTIRRFSVIIIDVMKVIYH